MKISSECLNCIYNQSTRIPDFLNLTPTQSKQISQIAKRHIKSFDYNLTPPHNATPMHEDIASKKALEFDSTCRGYIITLFS